MAELHLTFFSICRGQEEPVAAVLSADGGPAPAIVSAEKIEGQPVALRPMTPSFRKVMHKYNFFHACFILLALESPTFYSDRKKCK